MRFEKVSLEEFTRASGFDFDKAKELYNDIQLPHRSTKYSAGYDFYLPYTVVIPRGAQAMVATGIRVLLDLSNVLLCFPRSSLGIKHGVGLKNTVGVIDADYYYNADNEGHIMACLTNLGDHAIRLDAGDRFMQGIILPYYTVDDDTSNDTRRGGIGSTGV